MIHLKVVRGDGFCLHARHGQTSLPAASLEELEAGIVGIEAVVGKRGHITWNFGNRKRKVCDKRVRQQGQAVDPNCKYSPKRDRN